VADIFSANDIHVYLFSALRPTPEVSFAVRELGAQCGVVLTASHNPPEYNGYKVYWEDGGQIVPPHDNAIIEEINATQFSDIQFVAKPDNITFVDKEVDKVFQDACVANGRLGNGDRSKLKIVFTSLHGTSITAIPAVLQKAGYSQVYIVDEQAEPDGDFPTVDSPNPEEPAALALALQKAEEVNADIVIGTDPDADRLGIAVRNQKGELELLNGNQTMIVMTQFILEHLKRNQNKAYFIGSTVVSTPMMEKLASHYNLDCKIGLTGFKWIAKMIEDYPDEAFVGGGEESFGFMVGDFVRDKDAITSSLLACEVASTALSNGETFFDQLLKAYEAFGLYQEKLVSFVKKGKEHCYRGDVFQLVLSRQFSQKFKGDEFNVYRTLRSINPSPYLFFFDYGYFKIFGSSPEAQLIVDNGKAEIHPIAGTFRRTGNDLKDTQAANELAKDPKENSEHVMLVDLARNDLSRNGSNVLVEKNREIQFFSHVITIFPLARYYQPVVR